MTKTHSINRVRFIDPERLAAIIEAYESGQTIKAIAATIGMHHVTCGRILKLHGIRARGPRERATRQRRRYTLDTSFFKTIDTEEKAYWLGFVTADGCVSENRRLSIALQIRDKHHLEKMRDDLRSNATIRDAIGMKSLTPLSRICFDSVELGTDLTRLGVVARKSLIVKPYAVAPELARHYWRGVVDGDGSIYRCVRRSEFKGDGKQHTSDHWQVELAGSRWIVQGFADYVVGIGGPMKTARAFQTIFKVAYGGIALPQMIVRELYEGSAVFLDRKMDLANQLVAIVPRQKYLRGLTAETLRSLYEKHGRWDDVAAELGCHENGLYHLRKRLGIVVPCGWRCGKKPIRSPLGD
jgi:transposase-like protein